MMKMKPFVALATTLFAVTIVVPTLLVLPFSEGKVSGKLGEELKEKPVAVSKPATTPSGPAVEVAVYRTGTEQLEKLPLEDYVVGVVASEMPAEFEKEALKAQALTARTYIVKQLLNSNSLELPKGANVTDTQIHQVYMNDSDMKKAWGADYKWKIKKIKEAVAATSGQILTYDGSPIDATFFSTSNGYTENAEDVWSDAKPYLKSVESPWDVNTEKYKGQKVLTVNQFEAILGVKLTDSSTIGKIIEKTKGNRVGKVDINGKVLTGIEIREKLDLKSTDFTWERKGNNIIINTEGYGHGVGMSQFGANGMATEGKTYKDIVLHYYKGVKIDTSDGFLTKITAKK